MRFCSISLPRDRISRYLFDGLLIPVAYALRIGLRLLSDDTSHDVVDLGR